MDDIKYLSASIKRLMSLRKLRMRKLYILLNKNKNSNKCLFIRKYTLEWRQLQCIWIFVGFIVNWSSQISIYWIIERITSKLKLRPLNQQLMPANIQLQYNYPLNDDRHPTHQNVFIYNIVEHNIMSYSWR